MVGDDAVGSAAFDQVVGDVETGGVDESGDDVAGAVELGDGLERALVEPALDVDAIDFFADAALHRVDDVVDLDAAGQLDAA